LLASFSSQKTSCGCTEISSAADHESIGKIYDACIFSANRSVAMKSSVTETRVVGEMTAQARTCAGLSATTIGNYSIIRELGRGGMGIVYLAHDATLDRQVAVKVLCGNSAAEKRQRFGREGQLTARFKHANIVQIYSSEIAAGTPFLVQEYVEGGNLSQWQQRLAGPPAVAAVLRIGRDIARALIEAARQQVVHRDIKPSNILLTAAGEAKLADLGIACLAAAPTSESQRLTGTGVVLGSHGYMAPEIVANAGAADSRSDIYSLGVTLHELLSGERWGGYVAEQALMQHPELDNDRRLRQRIVRLLKTMTAAAPQDRFADGEKLLTALIQAEKEPRIVSWRHAAAVVIAALMVMVMGGNYAHQHLLPATAPAPPLTIPQQLLLENDYATALPLLQQIVEQQPGNIHAWYALGLCYIAVADTHQLQQCLQRLNELHANELAQHLQALHLLEQGQDAAAHALLAGLPTESRYKLPLLFSKGQLLMRANDYEQAEIVLSTALQEAAFFDFERLRLVDLLGRLWVSRGKPAQAARLYEQNIRNTSLSAPAPMLTNYAMALVESGEQQQAVAPLRQALQKQPDDTVAQYMLQRLLATPAAAAPPPPRQDLQQIIASIAELEKLTGEQLAQGQSPPAWLPPPLIVAILPLRVFAPVAEVRLLPDYFYVDALIAALRDTAGLTIVDREVLDQALVELRLASSRLSQVTAAPQLGKLLPATLLLRPSLSLNSEHVVLRLELIDVQSSEIIDVFHQQAALQTSPSQLATNLVATLQTRLRQRHPLAGQVKIGVGNDAPLTLNLGRLHGLSRDAQLWLYPPVLELDVAALGQTAPLARAVIESQHDLSAQLRLLDPAVAIPDGAVAIIAPLAPYPRDKSD